MSEIFRQNLTKGMVVGYVLSRGPQWLRDAFMVSVWAHLDREREQIDAEMLGMTVDEYRDWQRKEELKRMFGPDLWRDDE